MATEEFEHESLQDPKSIAEYLGAVTAGLEAGQLTLSDDHGQLELRPRGLLGLLLRARRQGSRVKLRVELSWTEEHAQTPAGPLHIRAAR